MGTRRDTWLDQTGLKLIRVVIGSHFCAMALGVPMGFDPFFLIGLILPGDLAQSVGAAALFTLAIAFVFGVKLRVVSLILAGFMIFSATLTLLFSGDAHSIGALWQSISLGAAVMLCYGPMRPHELHKTALFPARTVRGAVAKSIKDGVTPRRVKPRKARAKAERPDPFVHSFAPLIAPTERMIGVANAEKPTQENPKPKPKRKAQREMAEDDIQNIFANI
ncbi:MAG: hypothetical protein AAFZ04_03415 [Pseudomonadota bacterium]